MDNHKWLDETEWDKWISCKRCLIKEKWLISTEDCVDIIYDIICVHLQLLLDMHIERKAVIQFRWLLC